MTSSFLNITFLVNFILFPWYTGFPDKTFPPDVIYKNYHVQIEEESHLVINGNTNINSFSCGYNGNFYKDTLTVNTIANGDHLKLRNAQLKLKTALFDCQNKMMNPDFQNLLKADEYPYILIKVLYINKNRKDLENYLVSNKTNNTVLLNVEITLAGQKNTYQIPIDTQQIQNDRYYSGHLNVDIRDFGLTPPKKMLGLVVVNEMVSIDFFVKLTLL